MGNAENYIRIISELLSGLMIITIANFVFVLSRHKDSEINIVLKRIIGILAAAILMWIGLAKLIDAIHAMSAIPS